MNPFKNPFRAVYGFVGSLTSAAIPMAIAARTQQAYEQGLVEWEAENEVSEPITTQDRYFGPRSQDWTTLAAEMFPQHTSQSSAVIPPSAAADRPAPPDSTTVVGAGQTPESGESNPPETPDSGPSVICSLCGKRKFWDERAYVHSGTGFTYCTPKVSPSPDGSQQQGDEIRGTGGAADTASGGGTDRPTSALLDDAAHLLGKWAGHYPAFIAELRARADFFRREIEQGDEPGTAPSPTDGPLRRAFGLTPDDPIPDFPM